MHNKALLQVAPPKTAIAAGQGTHSFVARPKVERIKHEML